MWRLGQSGVEMRHPRQHLSATRPQQGALKPTTTSSSSSNSNSNSNRSNSNKSMHSSSSNSKRVSVVGALSDVGFGSPFSVRAGKDLEWSALTYAVASKVSTITHVNNNNNNNTSSNSNSNKINLWMLQSPLFFFAVAGAGRDKANPHKCLW